MLIKLGDLFQLGENYWCCGDSKDDAIVRRVVREWRITMILADPPYAVEYVESKAGLGTILKARIIANDHDQTDDEYRLFTKEWLNAVKEYLDTKNSVKCLFSRQSFSFF